MVASMNYFHLILLCHFVSINSVMVSYKHHDCKGSSQAPHSVKFRIIGGNKVIPNINLMRTKRSLANSNLPIWILTHAADEDCFNVDDCSRLESTHEVMKDLGEFTTYQDAMNNAAAIYFHKRREFDGMINYEFIIRKLPVDKIHIRGKTALILNSSGVYSRPGYEGHTNDRGLNEEDPDAGVNYQNNMRTSGSHVYDGHPEVLVIVSWDVAEDWTQIVQESEHYTTIVSHVLTLFNGVDMLYSKLKNTKIQINIAGIIIGRAKESFNSFQECYHPEIMANNDIVQRLHGSCVNGVLRNFLDTRRGEILPDSYDMVIFLTRENIYNINTEGDDASRITFQQVGGLSGSVDDLYECRQYGEHVILVGTVTVKEYLDRYPTIAHEMAHLMTLNHDETPLFTPEGKCRGNLLKTVEKWCDKCLSWSETSEQTFKLFFSSPNCCTFINQPRSLRPPKPSIMLTASEQCRCYGHLTAWDYGNGYPLNYCYSQLQCWSMDGGMVPTVMPLDGTPCGTNEVCWDQRCQEL